jgi:hypothetical protein
MPPRRISAYLAKLPEALVKSTKYKEAFLLETGLHQCGTLDLRTRHEPRDRNGLPAHTGCLSSCISKAPHCHMLLHGRQKSIQLCIWRLFRSPALASARPARTEIFSETSSSQNAEIEKAYRDALKFRLLQCSSRLARHTFSAMS